MKNPYDDIFEPEEIRLGKGAAWAAVVAFLLVCIVPPAWRNVTAAGDADVASAWELLFQKDPSQTIVEHLRSAEAGIEDAPFTDPPRQFLQAFLTRVFGAGNTKTVVGQDGWLFFRPAVDAVTQTGPMRAPPLGAASDPALRRWHPARPAILRFAAELAEREIELILVPVPVKPMVYPEHLTGRAGGGPVTHRDAAAFYAALEESGITVADYLDEVFALKNGGDSVFLKQDTHWTPRTMAFVAERVAGLIRSRPWADALDSEFSRYSIKPLERSARGDLVENLDFPAGSTLFPPEAAELQVVVDARSGGRPAADRQSPVVLLGDSFVNIFDDPNLGFAGAGGDGAAEDVLIGAGFAQHLAAELGAPLDVIAVNGQAATQVRQDFARRFDDDVRKKKAVIWLIASRDLFLTPRPAMANGVIWENVSWNPKQRPRDGGEGGTPPQSDGGVTVEAVLVEKATIPDPRTLPYRDSTYETLWEVQRVISGEPALVEDGQLFVKPWAFRDKKLVETARLVQGQRYRFAATPMDLVPDAVRSAQTQPLEETPFLEEFFAESFDPVGSSP